jgi:hypothetical protein
MRREQISIFLIIFLLFLDACRKPGPAPEIPINKCYPTTSLQNVGLYSKDEFRLDSNKNLIDHYHSGYKGEHLSFRYNKNQQIVRSIYHLTDKTESIDTTDYLYYNDILKSAETRHYVEFLSNPPAFAYKITSLFDYKLNGDLITVTTYIDDEIHSYQEQNYVKDKLVSIVSYDNNHTETGNLGLEYNEKENSISLSMSGRPYEKICYDNKNSPLKYINLFNPSNRRIPFDNLMYEITFTNSGFLFSDHNPAMIIMGPDTVKYSYVYNEYDFPTSYTTSDHHSHQFEFDCDKNQ